MKLTINQPELLNIVDNVTKKSTFGGNQAWYQKSWNQKSGCGPTCAANIMAYLALTREQMQKLYQQQEMEKEQFLKHMDDLFSYITPGPMGVNKLGKFVDGANKFALDRNISLHAHVLSVDKKDKEQRSREKLESFMKEALTQDTPIAFLNLSRGEEVKIQNWHWITITSAEIGEDYIVATASDEGEEIEFDLLLWYMTTKKHGGLIYFT